LSPIFVASPIHQPNAYSKNEREFVMRPVVFTLIFAFLITSMHYALATEEKESCGRLSTGDTFDDLNKILDCIESKVSGQSFVTATNTAIYSGEKEPNDLIGNANIITIDTTIKGRIKKGDDFDIFQFTAPEAKESVRVIVRQTDPDGFYPTIRLYDDAEVLIQSVNGYPGKTISHQFTIEPQRSHYIVLTCRTSCSKNPSYELLVRAE
jgi:hypothetical protein